MPALPPSTESHPHTPPIDATVCERARLSRDARFDGLFFTAVTSTGIYCRPVCPAPAARRENVRYFAHAAAAESAGFRPCLRCRPELAPGNEALRRGDTLVAQALRHLEQGALLYGHLPDLAQRLGVSERHLRRQFQQRLGASPLQVHTTQRLLFAKQLLTETTVPITQVALAAGFQSLRRFNAAFLEAYRLPPRDVRRAESATPPSPAKAVRHAPAEAPPVPTLRLHYRPPLDWDALLAFFRHRALPGLESVDADSYTRFCGKVRLRVSPWDRRSPALKLEIHGAPPAQWQGLVQRVRRLFDLDADPQAIHNSLAPDPLLAPLLTRHPGLRLPGAWNTFELAVRTVMGQQVSVAAARTLASRLMALTASQQPEAVAPSPDNGACGFPSPAQLLALPLPNLVALGLPRARAATLHSLAQAFVDGTLSPQLDMDLDTHVQRWTALPGIGAWTAQAIALRAGQHPDAWPANDGVLQRALAIAAATASPPGASTVSAAMLHQRAQAWRPWRAYAAMHLWHSMTPAFTPSGAPFQPLIPSCHDLPSTA